MRSHIFWLSNLSFEFESNQKVMINGLKNENFVHLNGKIGKIVKLINDSKEDGPFIEPLYEVSFNLDNDDMQQNIKAKRGHLKALEKYNSVTNYIYCQVNFFIEGFPSPSWVAK
jgi:hypothetical protein